MNTKKSAHPKRSTAYRVFTAQTRRARQKLAGDYAALAVQVEDDIIRKYLKLGHLTNLHEVAMLKGLFSPCRVPRGLSAWQIRLCLLVMQLTNQNRSLRTLHALSIQRNPKLRQFRRDPIATFAATIGQRCTKRVFTFALVEYMSSIGRFATIIEKLPVPEDTRQKFNFDVVGDVALPRTVIQAACDGHLPISKAVEVLLSWRARHAGVEADLATRHKKTLPSSRRFKGDPSIGD